MKDLYKREDWYRVRDEEEKIYNGFLRRLPRVATPNQRDLNYFLEVNNSLLPLYIPKNEILMDEFVGCRVKIYGKLIDLSSNGFGKELWIGSIEKDN
jgi:hypothetical protein